MHAIFAMMVDLLVPSFGFNWACDTSFLISTFKKGPSHLAQLRITFKSGTNSFPRRTRSSILFHRCELSIVWCRPWSIQDWFGASWKGGNWGFCLFWMVSYWCSLIGIRSQGDGGSNSHRGCSCQGWRGFWGSLTPRWPRARCWHGFVGP